MKVAVGGTGLGVSVRVDGTCVGVSVGTGVKVAVAVGEYASVGVEVEVDVGDGVLDALPVATWPAAAVGVKPGCPLPDGAVGEATPPELTVATGAG